MVKKKLQQQELYKKLWDMANELRGNMTANEFKDYILGLIFYRFLSEKVEIEVETSLEGEGLTYEEAWENKEYKQVLIDEIAGIRGYIIEPKYLFSKMVTMIDQNDEKFDVEYLQDAITALIESTEGHESNEVFQGLFDDMDLTNNSLGKDVKTKTKSISKVMSLVNEISFNQNDTEIDILGDAYEYLIGKFAASGGKKAGEFYTPQEVSTILARITTIGKDKVKSVYDPTCGSGSLLLRVNKEAKVGKFYGQESISTTFNLAKMNMLLHGVDYDRFDIRNNNTITDPEHLGEEFEIVVANPPYSQKWSSDSKYKTDPRFAEYGELVSKNYADYVFVQHMIYHLEEDGVMAVVLPHGVLFRGGKEETIRTYLIENKNYLDGIIGLPENLFYGTGIPTCIMVFKKNRKDNDSVLFVDASKGFTKVGNKNMLRDEDVDKIVETYEKREEIEKYSHNASIEEIKENDYNLNIPRYIDTFEPEPRINIDLVDEEIVEIKEEINKVDKELKKYFKELGL